MAKVRNVLFIMCDQLRADYLGCMGHPTLRTPNIDSLAARGVTFTQAFCSSPVCGPSRASFYTGRSMFSHGVAWNFVPLSVREKTIGDYLRPHGLTVALSGKIHHEPDRMAIKRLQIDPDSDPGRMLADCGFVVADNYEGHSNPGRDHPYVTYLKKRGYGDSSDPWEDHVMSAIDESGEKVSGWLMRNVHLPARVKEEDSETAYTTDVALEFLRRQGDAPWFLHLSYIKPHWPYLAPAPYHATYSAADCTPVVRGRAELDDEHPVLGAYRQHRESRTFSRQEVCDRVRPVYMGLVKQLDDHIGRVIDCLQDLGRLEDTLIVFTSDHGDYLGDHWLGEKELFHHPSVRIPFIVCDPDPLANASRGSRDGRLVEAIDVLPTTLDALGIPGQDHLLEGRSLLPAIRGGPDNGWRDIAVSESDYSFRPARETLGQDIRRCRGTMLFDGRWKSVFWDGFRPQIFDLASDPDEMVDLHKETEANRVLSEHRDRHYDWMRARKLTTTLPADGIVVSERDVLPKRGIKIGHW